MKRKIKYIIVFILVCFLGAFLVYLTDNSCDAISNYNWTVQFGIGILFFALIKMIIIFIVGILLFLLFRKKIRHKKYDKIKLIYFAILPLFVFHYQFLLIPNNIINRSTVHSICEKSSTDGMTTHSKNINLSEYNFLQDKLFLLPNIPNTSDSIDLDYYHDGFLGDFSLDVTFACDIYSRIDILDKRWSVTKINKVNKKKHIYYHDNKN